MTQAQLLWPVIEANMRKLELDRYIPKMKVLIQNFEGFDQHAEFEADLPHVQVELLLRNLSFKNCYPTVMDLSKQLCDLDFNFWKVTIPGAETSGSVWNYLEQSLERFDPQLVAVSWKCETQSVVPEIMCMWLTN
jgi:hypothetical protein